LSGTSGRELNITFTLLPTYSYQLATINYGYIDQSCSNLTPGAEICLGYENEDCSTTYIVKADDTCEGIASAVGVNSTILTQNNPQIDGECGNIYIGEVSLAPYHCISFSPLYPSPRAQENSTRIHDNHKLHCSVMESLMLVVACS
jgi:hypothetical protein